MSKLNQPVFNSILLIWRGILRKFDNLCSAELYDTKFIVPCDPEGILIENYGASWYEPKQKNFQWPLFDMTKVRVHNDEEWSKLFVKYDKYGKIISEKDPWINFKIIFLSDFYIYFNKQQIFDNVLENQIIKV